MEFQTFTTRSELESRFAIPELAKQLHEMLKPFEDTVAQIEHGLVDALNGRGSVSLGFQAEKPEPLAICVMMQTGMAAYIPENLLLYVAVDKSCRGQGIGRKILECAFASCKGSIKLHVEHDNPAQRLYERLGFTSKYREMRLERS